MIRYRVTLAGWDLPVTILCSACRYYHAGDDGHPCATPSVPATPSRFNFSVPAHLLHLIPPSVGGCSEPAEAGVS